MNPLNTLNNKKMFYVSMDGDDIGKHHGQAILSDNPEEVEEISNKINAGQEVFGEWANRYGGKQISFGGDEGLWEVPEEALEELEAIRKDYEYTTGFTVSVGVGSKMSESGQALLVAKVKGKNQTIFYSPEIEKEINKIVEDAKSGHGSSEESKLAEAYLQPSNQKENDRNSAHEVENSAPPQDDNNRGYDSGYKDDDLEDRNDSYQRQDLTPPIVKKPNLESQPVTQEATSTEIQECDRLMNEIPSTPEEQPPEIEKPDPKGYDENQNNEQAIVEEKESEYRKPGDLKYGDSESKEPNPENLSDDSTSDIAEEKVAEDMGPQELSPEQSKDRENLEQDPTGVESLDQNIENAKDYQQSIERPKMEGGANLPAEVKPEHSEKPKEDGELTSETPSSVEEMLDANIDNTKDMIDEQGVSRPEDYNQKQGDMGLSEEEQNGQPNINDVLKEGLDNHADNIHREKIVNLVAEALEGFKSQKHILDKAKEQAPQLYDSCIQMLRAMIELCSLAGIDESQAEQEVNEIEGQGEAPEEIPGAESMPEQAAPEEVPPESPQP